MPTRVTTNNSNGARLRISERAMEISERHRENLRVARTIVDQIGRGNLAIMSAGRRALWTRGERAATIAIRDSPKAYLAVRVELALDDTYTIHAIKRRTSGPRPRPLFVAETIDNIYCDELGSAILSLTGLDRRGGAR